MSHDHLGRLARARAQLRVAELDALLASPSADLVYLVGYDAPELERLTVLVARPGGDALLVVPELERPRAEASPAGGLVDVLSWRDGDDPYRMVREILGDGARIGASDRMWAVHLIELQRSIPRATFVPGSTVLSPLRARKDPGEIQLLGRAGRSADEAFRRILREGLEGRSEEEIARSLAGHLVDSGHDSAAFTIVASGPNAASPHHLPGSRSIRTGDTVVMDFGGRVGGYCSDVTRTVSAGDPGQEAREVHELVLQAQEAAFRAVSPGVPAQDVDRAAREVVEDAGFGSCFLHRTGHGIGLEEHEAPYIVEGNREPLEPGMCFSIEPGIYVHGRFGVRIEDIVTVTETGAARLNRASRELAAVS